jgi:heat-inducible transcriptional repressor
MEILVGKDFSEILDLGKTVTDEFKGYREIFESVMCAIEDYIDNSNPEVIIEGEGKILKHPEYNDTEKVKDFLSVVTSKDRLAGLLAENSDNIEINIKIGGEDGAEMPKDCSLVTATYSASGVKLGTYGVIGPLRMDYKKVVSVLEGVGKILEDVLKNKK